ncbi:hypothetical protein Adt_14614 [Abeliophyllum distichum]|uniref:Uncharacterized protein n=1 Tax=Abeliophyllum distichum TaxID=126358 RepID=A0ABD1U047_9LAMI
MSRLSNQEAFANNVRLSDQEAFMNCARTQPLLSMVGFYFSKIPVFKIAGIKGDGEKVTLPPQLPISSMMSVLIATVSLVLEATMGISSSIRSGESLLSLENARQQGKGKEIVNDE